MSAVLRAVVGYCFLVLITRIVVRRPGRQMTPFEYILIFFIGGLMLTALIGDDRSFTNAAVVIMTVAVTHFALAWLRQISPAVGRILDGTPIVLLSRGEIHLTSMRQVGIGDADIMAAARDKGLKDFSQIQYAILERNGEISIISAAPPTQKDRS